MRVRSSVKRARTPQPRNVREISSTNVSDQERAVFCAKTDMHLHSSRRFASLDDLVTRRSGALVQRQQKWIQQPQGYFQRFEPGTYPTA